MEAKMEESHVLTIFLMFCLYLKIQVIHSPINLVFIYKFTQKQKEYYLGNELPLTSRLYMLSPAATWYAVNGYNIYTSSCIIETNNKYLL